MYSNLRSEIRDLHAKIAELKTAFDEGIKNDHEFEDLKKIYLEIKELELQLAKCFENSAYQSPALNASTDLKKDNLP